MKAFKRCTAIKLAVVFVAKKKTVFRSPFVKSNESLLCKGCYCVEKRAGWFELFIFIDILRKFTCMTEALLFLYVLQEIKALQIQLELLQLQQQ